MKTSIYVPDYNNTISIPLLGDLDLDLDLLGILFFLTRALSFENRTGNK